MSRLDADLIRDAAALDGLRVDAVEEVGSTNQVLMEAPLGGDPAAPRLLAAARQTAGRGRRGRPWQSAQGRSVAFSLALERRVDAQQPPAAVSLAVGAAAAGALARWAADVRLKWPNDLLRARSKLGGILVECRRGVPGTAPDGGVTERIVVGIGLNLLAPRAASVDQPACGLFDGADVPPRAAEAVIGALAAAVVPAVRRFLDEGLGPFMQAWRSLDALAGEQVALLDAGRVVAVGRSLGIDESGGLRVQTDAGLRVVHSGEVSLRPLDAVR
ncbi:MAG: biotin--[acetyl-CoA-carboxylase] ligase [Burkholderiaceae bacterium]|nr:biotin--[acetyl-CoA-carboxylase] ligase [Burkholderiaceae bacterium]